MGRECKRIRSCGWKVHLTNLSISFAIHLYNFSSSSRSRVSFTRRICQDPSVCSPNLVEEENKNEKHWKEDNILWLKKVPKCSVDANYKEGPRNAKGSACSRAMWKAWPGHGPRQDVEGENRKEVLRKKWGIVRCCNRQLGSLPYRRDRDAWVEKCCGFVSCFCNCVVSSQGLLKIIHRWVYPRDGYSRSWPADR